jgi:hypothetical protein
MKLLLQVAVEPKPDTYLKLKPKSPKKSPWIFFIPNQVLSSKFYSYPSRFSSSQFSPQ